MSTAVYPLGMKTMPASGYTHKSTYYNKEYKTWKGSGINQKSNRNSSRTHTSTYE